MGDKVDRRTVQKLNQFVNTFNCGTILKHYAEVLQNKKLFGKSNMEQFLFFLLLLIVKTEVA